MNISYNWLKQYIDFDLSIDELSEALTSLGLEVGSVEEVETVRGGLKGLVIGRVLTCEDHPDSDHLHLTTVDVGQEEPLQIVCGAPNVAAGQTVVVATIGTVLYDGDKEIKIKKGKMRGVDSYGMICAEDEIGIGSSHDGIIVIDQEVTPGTPAAEFYNIKSDWLIEVDLTPNRIDAASHFGVARDLSAWLQRHGRKAYLKRPSAEGFRIDMPEGGMKVRVENYQACIRYCGITVRNVTVKESPDWLKERLTVIGLRPINNIVDISNYLLHSLGLPLHTFDRDRLAGETVVIRSAAPGEKITTLDDVERTLTADDLLICDNQRGKCIAGVFGGKESGVTEYTHNVFIESACFHPTWIRKTARRQGLNTDASFRYERGCDPNLCPYVLKIAAMMVKELAGGEITGPFNDIYPKEVKPVEVTLRYESCDKLIGKKISHETILDILRSLEMEVVAGDDTTVMLKVPTYRVDVTRECDVIEDLLRVYGYNNVEISEQVKSSLSYRQFWDESQSLRTKISEQLTGTGFNEILNNSLSAESYYRDLSCLPLDHCVTLLNPLSSDLAVMRQTLLFGGLEVVAHNINHKRPDLLAYEFGNVYFFNPQAISTAEEPLEPYSESHKLGLWMSGSLRQASWLEQPRDVTFYDLKGVVADVLARLNIPEKMLRYEHCDCCDELYSAALKLETRQSKCLGHLGVVSEGILAKHDIKQPVYFAELDWKALVELSLSMQVTYYPLPRTQEVRRDLALLLDRDVTFEQVEAVVREAERKLLKKVTLFDVYEGKNLPEGKKSYAINITLQDDDKTLNDHQIDASMNRVIQALQTRLGAQLR